jgi:RND family efflux transporter MFP subunit
LDKEKLSALRIDPAKKTSGQVIPRRRRRDGLFFGAVLVTGLLGYFLYDRVIDASLNDLEIGKAMSVFPYQALSLLIASGYVVPQMQADVATKATGRLEWIDVEEGGRVERGQLIARLDNQDVLALKEKAEAEVEVAKARLAEAEAELRDAQRSLARTKTLVKKDVLTQEVYDGAIAREEKALAAVQSFKAAVDSAEATLHGAIVDVESTLIRAPFDGVVLRKYANIGDVVAPFSSTIESKGAVLSMADLDTLEVEVDVSESELHKVRVGQPCKIELEALPDRRFRCSVSRIVPTVDKARATVLVRVRFVDKDNRVLPNMSARVTFLSEEPTAEQEEPVTVVPVSAIVMRDGKEVVFLAMEGTATHLAVETGERMGDVIEIRRGLKAGDRVVLHPPDTLKDGSAISASAF